METLLPSGCSSRQQLVESIKSREFIDPQNPAHHSNGPDYVIETEDIFTWKPTGAVQIKPNEYGATEHPPMSVVSCLERTARKYPDRCGLAVKRDGQWYKWTFKQYLDDVRLAAKAFIKLGLEPLHSVGIIGFNSPEWVISNIAAIFAGGISAGIYTTNSPEACRHVLADSLANIVVVENKKQLDKILEIRNQLPHLKCIIQYTGESSHPDVLTWSDVLEIGESVKDEILEKRIRGIAVNQCCSLVYTSGTTGEPKGVMASHDNITFNVKQVHRSLGLVEGGEITVSYLPLNHTAAQLLDIHGPILYAASVYFAQPDALKGGLKDTFLEVRPTTVLGVPRIWEKMYAAITEKEASMGFFGQLILRLARKIETRHAIIRNAGGKGCPFGYSLVNLVLRKVRAALGFDQARSFITGAAPIAKEILEYFHSIGVPITEGFGMSETGANMINELNYNKIGSIGRTLTHSESKIFNPDSSGEGEICIRGRTRFMGYFNSEKKTRECIDSEGWCHSGDLGRMDEDGFYYITGRIKELLITAGGENVAPTPIEERIKKELPIISNAMVVGDRLKFLSVLLTLKTEIDLDTGGPIDELTKGVKEWCKSVGCSAETVYDVLKGSNEPIMAAVQKGIDRANRHAISNAQKIQKFAFVPADFSVLGGEIGPTLKMRRHFICQKYEDIISTLYQ